MGWSVLLVLAVGSSEPVLAQARPGAGEILIDSTGPDPRNGESTYVPLPPAGPERDAFLAAFIRVDARDNRVTRGGKPISAFDFYNRVGRPDLAAEADERTRQRIWLMSGGGLTIVAGVVSGLLVMASGPDTSSPDCLARGPDVYKSCVEQSSRATTAGALLIGAGVALGGALIVWGITTPEMVTTREETVRLASDYNRGLGQRHGATGVRLELLPAIAPGFAGLSARLRF